jgi:hypothetical protein
MGLAKKGKARSRRQGKHGSDGSTIGETMRTHHLKLVASMVWGLDLVVDVLEGLRYAFRFTAGHEQLAPRKFLGLYWRTWIT